MNNNLNKFLFAFLSIFLTTNAFGQKEMKYGLKAGAGIASVSFDDTERELSPLKVFHGGLFLDYIIKDQFSVAVEAIYSMKGVKSLETFTTTDSGIAVTKSYDTKFKFTYIVIPVLPTYKFNNGFFIQAGPTFSILFSGKETGAKTTSTTGQSDIVEPIDDSWTSYLNTTEIGLAGGIGFQSKMGLGISARYEFGLTDAFNYSGYDLARNTLMSVSVSYVVGTKL
jgi:hypothetical protein